MLSLHMYLGDEARKVHHAVELRRRCARMRAHEVKVLVEEARLIPKHVFLFKR